MKFRRSSEFGYMPDYAQLISLILSDTLMLVSIIASVVGALFGVLAMRFFSRRMVRKAYERGQEDLFVSRSQAEAQSRQFESELYACRNALSERTSAVAVLESQLRESSELERKHRELKIELSDKDSLIESLRMEIEMLRTGSSKLIADSGLDLKQLETVVDGLRQGIDQLQGIVQHAQHPKQELSKNKVKSKEHTSTDDRELDRQLSGTEVAETLPIKRQRELLP
jgi:hypothetical protein